MPALNINTDTSKCYTGLPQQWSPFGSRSLAGHRIAQTVSGRQFQVTTDDFFRSPSVDSTYEYMVPPANLLGYRNTKKS